MTELSKPVSAGYLIISALYYIVMDMDYFTVLDLYEFIMLPEMLTGYNRLIYTLNAISGKRYSVFRIRSFIIPDLKSSFFQNRTRGIGFRSVLLSVFFNTC